MSGETFKKEEDKPTEQAVKQTVDRVNKKEPEQEENEPGEQKQEQIRTKEGLNEASEKLNKIFEEQKSDSEEAKDKTEKQQKVSANEFFEEAKAKENEIKLSPVGKVTEIINNTSKSQEARDKTAERKMPEVVKALKEMGGSLENIKKNTKTLLSIGAGWGENMRDLAEKLEAEKIIGIDKNTVSSESVKKKMGGKLTWVNGNAMEAMRCFEDMSIDLSELTAFLQVLNREDKIEVLKEVERISELVVVVDEIKRSGLKGIRDLAMNKLYNAGMGKYDILNKEDWEKIFNEAGLVVKAFNEFGENDFVAILKKVEEKVEE
ncbi:MAG: methyltransferase domain-containing protein [Candidatus Pacebacteria bacterium]|nr:methyltransferase domain-containing protein [Candidatus Paceibacterota bacterium]